MRGYPGKLLLFGEYVLLLDAPALALPIPAFSGWWVHDAGAPFGDEILRFAHSKTLANIPLIDAQAMQTDVAAGLRFRSNIPQGYGMGSSGALVAAVYDRYAREKTADFDKLRAILAEMESFFHGQSSGLDPLTSYLDMPLFIPGKNTPEPAQLKTWNKPPPRIFLIDTGKPRQTAPLVARFLEMRKSPSFNALLERTWLQAHEVALQAWMDAESDVFWPALRLLSEAQLNLVSHLVEDDLKKFWKKTLTEENFLLKICGAGGGGFVLGFARPDADWSKWPVHLPIIFPVNGDDGDLAKK